MIIGISGKAGSGKDTIARMILWYTMDPELRESLLDGVSVSDIRPENYFLTTDDSDLIHLQATEFMNWKKISFADPIKEMAAKIVGGNPWSREWKDANLSSEWNINNRNITGRELLIRLGTEVRERVHLDFWLNGALRNYKKYKVETISHDSDNYQADSYFEDYPNIIIPDLRYRNEADAILNWADNTNDLRILIRVECPKQYLKLIDDPSEMELDDYDKFDITLENRSDKIPNIESLWEAVLSIMESHPDLKETLTI